MLFDVDPTVEEEVEQEVDDLLFDYRLPETPEALDSLANGLEIGLAGYERGSSFGSRVIARLRQRAEELRGPPR